jgi:hypothetical protein
MIKQPIRNLRTNRAVPPRFCDIVIDGEEVYLEQKIGKNRYITILWEDLVHQVGLVLKANSEKLPQSAP